MKRKLTTIEKRASALCESIREGSTKSITVEWVKSAMWGRNPRIMHYGEKVTNVSGCGYCKHSKALANALKDLGQTEDEKRNIGRTGGAGVSSTIAALDAAEWTLKSIASGKAFDCYTISPKSK